MKRSVIRKEFLEKYEQWASSGLTRAEFCRRENIKYSWFMSHQKKEFRKEREQTISDKGFAKIETQPDENTIGSAIEFHYPDGRYFVFSPGTAVGLIRELVS